MKTVILCGGRGTRLRDETEFRPKPLLPIGDRPVLWHIMRRYAKFGHNDFVLCLGYRGEMIKEWFRNLRWHTGSVSLKLGGAEQPTFNTTDEAVDWSVALCDTGVDTLTGGRIHAVREFVGNEPFFLTYGDGVGDIDLDALLAFHREQGAVCTLTAVHPPGRFGEIAWGKGGLVAAFNEKPQAEAGFINGGFMVCEPEIFDYLGPNPEVMLEEKPLRSLAQDGKLAAYRHVGFWQPMDTFHEYTLLNRMWREGRAPWL
jgi:glucose-1-phosphate cytidylyltransferase